ncbi:MAG: YajQ family cyclic di-GMP-binding protein [Bacillota bacterium]
MAKDCSFDVVSEVDLQEIDNAINQTRKEMSQRFDFKGSKSVIEWDKEEIRVTSEDEYRIKSIVDILQTKMVKRGVSLKALDYGKIEPAASSMVRQVIKIQQGIDKEKGKEIIAMIKKMKLKVQAQLMDNQVRIFGKKKDELQDVIQELKAHDFGIELQFSNFRD